VSLLPKLERIHSNLTLPFQEDCLSLQINDIILSGSKDEIADIINTVSILASFCVWTKSLMCKDAVNRDSTI
jgi:hypothetical protein